MSLGEMDTGRLLDVFGGEAGRKGRDGAGHGTGSGVAGGGGGGGVQSVLAGLGPAGGELWDENGYASQFDVAAFAAKLQAPPPPQPS
jgi:hypothetical protein